MFLSRPPRHPALEPLIERLWLFRAPGFAHDFDRMLPTGLPQVLFNLVEDETRVGRESVERLPGTILQGPFDRAFVIDTRQKCGVAGVELRAGALGSWVHGPELTCARVGIGELYRGDLRDRLLSGGSDASVLDRLEEVLVETRRRPPDRRIAAAAHALDRGRSVAAVSDGLGMTERRLREEFHRRTGLLPKRYARVRRLQRVLALAQGELEWGVIAHLTGFSDQAHLSREFRALTGLSPTAYRRRDRANPNHVVEGSLLAGVRPG